jgi:hypothetical protein
MYFSLMHEFMKLTEMLDMVVIFMFSKYGQTIIASIDSRNNIWKTRNNKEIKRRTYLSSSHSSILGTTFGKPGTTKKLKGENL